MPWTPWAPAWAMSTEITTHNDMAEERSQPSQSEAKMKQNEALRLILEQEIHTEPIGGFDIFLTKDQRLLKESQAKMSKLFQNDDVPDSISESHSKISFEKFIVETSSNNDVDDERHEPPQTASGSDINDISVSTMIHYPETIIFQNPETIIFNKHQHENTFKSPKNPHHIPSDTRETSTDFYRKSMLHYRFQGSIRTRERSAAVERVCKKGYKLRVNQNIDQGSYANTFVYEDDLMGDDHKILRYVWKGKLEKLSRHLHKDKNYKYINGQDAWGGRTACHFAAAWGCENTLQHLLRVPTVDVNLQDAQGKTPLFKAVENGSLACVRLLIQHGADPTITAEHQSNPFEYLLLKRGDESIELVECLYNQGGMKEQRKGDGIMCYLHILGFTEDLLVDEVAKLLLNAGEHINGTEGSGKTPLMVAVKYDQFHLAHLLISAGADLDHKDLCGKNALEHSKASKRCFGLIEKALIAKGVALQPPLQ